MARNPDETRSKVGRVISDYELDDLGDELVRRWTGANGDRWSLRQLATYFNERVLEAALESHDHRQTQQSVQNTYRSLTGDTEDPSAKTRAERNLQRNGIDTSELKADFVSHQAIHTFLTEYRDVTPPSSDVDPIETAATAINQLEGRTVAVTQSNLDRLARKGALAECDVEVFVEVTVFCNECGTSRPVNEYLQEGGCDCRTTE